MELFEYKEPQQISAPVLISVPHAGTFIPEDILLKMNKESIADLDDTDWFVDQLYEFALEMGIPILKANYSRLVVDLNRSAENTPLYSDGRLITGLVPETTFKGDPIYDMDLSQEEIRDRTNKFYHPYHSKISETLGRFLTENHTVVLFDAHSIRNIVPSISQTPFADLILSDQEHRSCDPQIFQRFSDSLSKSNFRVEENSLFKGGFITRNYGDPGNGINAMQLEMSKLCYMDDTQTKYEPERADAVIPVLRAGFNNLIEYLS